ncbi:MAG: MBL fold metallo-hydrolase [Actinomycetota bacterium]
MKVRVWGCRGSLASPGPDTVKYGGNTSSVEVRLDDGTLIILDAGTGIRALGRSLSTGEDVKQINLFLSHLHLDHVEGLGFFSALWDPDIELHVWGPPSPLRSLHDRLATLMSPPLFPVHLADVPCRPIYHDTPAEGTVTIGSAKVTVQDVTHRGSTVGYRIEEHGRTFAYIPDHEPALGLNLDQLDLEREDPGWISGYGIAHDADVLFHDSQYTEEEYPSHHAWGHSSVAHTVTFGLITKVKELVLFHHDPAHTDEQLEVHVKRAHELWGTHNTAPVLAYEGMSFELNGSKPKKPAGP